MQPVDPRVLRVIPEARPIMAGLGAVGIAQGVLAVAQAFAVSHLVVTVVRPGDPGALRAAMVWVGFVLAARGVLGWPAQVYAARAGLRARHRFGGGRRRGCRSAGLLAAAHRSQQHLGHVDHLDGTLMVDRVSLLKRRMIDRDMKKRALQDARP